MRQSSRPTDPKPQQRYVQIDCVPWGAPPISVPFFPDAPSKRWRGNRTKRACTSSIRALFSPACDCESSHLREAFSAQSFQWELNSSLTFCWSMRFRIKHSAAIFGSLSKRKVRRNKTKRPRLIQATGHPFPLPPCLVGHSGRSRRTDRLRLNLLARRCSRRVIACGMLQRQHASFPKDAPQSQAHNRGGDDGHRSRGEKRRDRLLLVLGMTID